MNPKEALKTSQRNNINETSNETFIETINKP